MPNYNALLVDADNTLLDFEAAEDAAIRETFAAMEVPDDEEMVALYKKINASLWRAFERKEVTQDELRIQRFSRFLSDVKLIRDTGKMAECFVRALSHQAHELAGAHDFLKKASARVPVIVVTNGIPEVQRLRFRLSTLSRYVTDYVISGEMGFAKPDPRMIERGLLLAGVSPNQALMLGDEPRSDIAAACAAGVDGCWFNPTGRANETLYKPTMEIQKLEEALVWL